MIYPQYLKANRAPRRTLLALTVLLLLGLVVWIMGMVMVYFHSGAEWGVPAPYAKNTLSQNTPEANWMKLEPELGEAPDAYLSREIGDAYLEAWQALNYAYRQKDREVWKDHFAESLWLEMDSLLLEQQDFLVNQADLSHHLYLHAFALDKQLVAFSDKGVRIKKKIADRREDHAFYNHIQRADFEVVMTLDDGKWKIRHFRRQPYSPQPESLLPLPDTLKVEVQQGQFRVGGKPFYPVGINYYPMQTPWFDFWTRFDTSVVRKDLELIRDLQLNTIRTFVFYDLFGGPDLQPAQLRHLDDLLDIAQQNGLKVILTLFDFLPDYQIQSYPSHEKHLKQLLTRYRHHPALLAWDLKNEPDLDFPVHGQEEVLDWLTYMAQRARIYDPDHPLTIGWSDAGSATRLAGNLDFLSFHFYRSPDSLRHQLDRIQAQAPDKMIVISEFGLPTYQYWWLPGGHTEAEQADYYQQVLSTSTAYPSVAFISWTLYDFPVLPDNVFGGPIWKTAPQKHFGIVRTDGQLKPAARILSNWSSR